MNTTAIIPEWALKIEPHISLLPHCVCHHQGHYENTWSHWAKEMSQSVENLPHNPKDLGLMLSACVNTSCSGRWLSSQHSHGRGQGETQ